MLAGTSGYSWDLLNQLIPGRASLSAAYLGITFSYLCICELSYQRRQAVTFFKQHQ